MSKISQPLNNAYMKSNQWHEAFKTANTFCNSDDKKHQNKIYSKKGTIPTISITSRI